MPRVTVFNYYQTCETARFESTNQCCRRWDVLGFSKTGSLYDQYVMATKAISTNFSKLACMFPKSTADGHCHKFPVLGVEGSKKGAALG
jgi:hypothetical protein